MNVVLALEPDASQTLPLTAVVRGKLGANLTIVPTFQAAIVAMNQRVPDVLLFGRDVPTPDREQAASHFAALTGAGGARTCELGKLTDAAAQAKTAVDIQMFLAAAEQERVRAMATVIDPAHHESELAGWNDFPPESEQSQVPVNEVADRLHVQAEIDRRVKSEVERLRRDADERIAAELRRVRLDAGGSPTVQSERGGSSLRSASAGRWRVAWIVAGVALPIGLYIFVLPNAVSTAARNSTTLVGTAADAAKTAAKHAVSVAPEVTRGALSAAQRMLPYVDIVRAPAAVRPLSSAPDELTSITGPGFLTAFSRIPMDVYADGKRIGSSDDGPLLIASGTHEIEFVSERFHYRAMASLTIPPGHVLPYTVALPSGDVRVVTSAGAEVSIDGERTGVAPLAPIHVPIGTREIRVRDTSGRENRQVVEVKLGDTLEVLLMPEAVTGVSSPATPRLAPLSR